MTPERLLVIAILVVLFLIVLAAAGLIHLPIR